MERTNITAALVLAVATGCTFGPRPRTSYEANPQVLQLPAVVVYQGSTGALSYQSAAGRDAQRLVPRARVQGRACQRGLQLPIFAPLYALGEPRSTQQGLWLSAGWGEGAYRQAFDDLRRQAPPEAVLYDLRADLAVRMILSVYREQCLVLDAGVLTPAAAAEPGGEGTAPSAQKSPAHI